MLNHNKLFPRRLYSKIQPDKLIVVKSPDTILLFNCTRNTSWRFYPPRSKNYEYDIYSPSKALHVFFPTIPSALSPCALWNAITAARVPPPKIPSTLPQLNPRLFNLS